MTAEVAPFVAPLAVLESAVWPASDATAVELVEGTVFMVGDATLLVALEVPDNCCAKLSTSAVKEASACLRPDRGVDPEASAPAVEPMASGDVSVPDGSDDGGESEPSRGTAKFPEPSMLSAARKFDAETGAVVLLAIDGVELPSTNWLAKPLSF